MLKGIDVSKHQGKIEWGKVKGQVDFAILRASYGWENYPSQVDEQLNNNVQGCIANGIPFGFYHYSYATTVEQAQKEADYCISAIQGTNPVYPVFFDVEDKAQQGIGKTALTEIAVAFCEKVKAAGFVAGVYASKSWWETRLDYEKLKEYEIWLAHWAEQTDFGRHYDLWQYTSSGSVPGVIGRVDWNYCYTEYGGASPAPQTGVDAIYRVRTQKHGWLPQVKNTEDYAGWENSPITDVAIKVSQGSVKYRAHVKGGSWLPYVTGCDTNEPENGYAGDGRIIDAIEVYYFTPDSIRPYKKAKYRAAPVNGNYFPWQYDNETKNGQDGYAGSFGKAISKFQLLIE